MVKQMTTSCTSISSEQVCEYYFNMKIHTNYIYATDQYKDLGIALGIIFGVIFLFLVICLIITVYHFKNKDQEWQNNINKIKHKYS